MPELNMQQIQSMPSNPANLPQPGQTGQIGQTENQPEKKVDWANIFGAISGVLTNVGMTITAASGDEKAFAMASKMHEDAQKNLAGIYARRLREDPNAKPIMGLGSSLANSTFESFKLNQQMMEDRQQQKDLVAQGQLNEAARLQMEKSRIDIAKESAENTAKYQEKRLDNDEIRLKNEGRSLDNQERSIDNQGRSIDNQAQNMADSNKIAEGNLKLSQDEFNVRRNAIEKAIDPNVFKGIDEQFGLGASANVLDHLTMIEAHPSMVSPELVRSVASRIASDPLYGANTSKTSGSPGTGWELSGQDAEGNPLYRRTVEQTGAKEKGVTGKVVDFLGDLSTGKGSNNPAMSRGFGFSGVQGYDNWFDNSTPTGSTTVGSFGLSGYDVNSPSPKVLPNIFRPTPTPTSKANDTSGVFGLQR